MKKYIALTVAAVAFASVSQAQLKDGVYAGIDLGYSYHTAQTQTVAPGTPAVDPKANASGFVTGVHFGYMAKVMEDWMWDVAMNVAYDTASVKVFSDANAVALYNPRGSLGITGRFGRMINACTAVFAGVGFDYSSATVRHLAGLKRINYAVNVLSIVPEVGVRGDLANNWTWTVTAGYKITLTADPKTLEGDRNVGYQFKKNPATFIAKVGVSYHF